MRSLARSLQRREQGRDIERLVADRVGPLGEHLRDELIHLRAVARDQHGARLGLASRTSRNTAAAVAVGYLHVDQDDLECRLLERLGRLAAVVRQADAEAALAEQVPEVCAQVAVVVDDQDQRLAERLVDQPEQRGEVDRLGERPSRPRRRAPPSAVAGPA